MATQLITNKTMLGFARKGTFSVHIPIVIAIVAVAAVTNAIANRFLARLEVVTIIGCIMEFIGFIASMVSRVLECYLEKVMDEGA